MYDYSCRVTKVWDGDTFDGVVDLGFLLENKGRFRLFGINAPELSTPEGIVSYQFLRNRVEGKEVIMVLVNPKTIHAEKFGRWLVVVYYNGVNINQEMKLLGLAEGMGSDGQRL